MSQLTMQQNPPSGKQETAFYDVCVMGLGYIGLPTASIFATRGLKVLGVDVIPRVVETINHGKIHIDEPDLDILVRAAVLSGNLRASLTPEPAKVFILAVPTPFLVTKEGSRTPDLTYVERATRAIAPIIGPGSLVILESTSPVGTTELVRDWLFDQLASSRPDEVSEIKPSLLFAHCPERILPGQMLKELVANDRICGGLTIAASEAAAALYKKFCSGEIFITEARTAEMCKLAENASRDVGIAFANELSLICDKLGIDVWEVIRLANRHPRVKILQPGPGVGGHCIAVDPWFLVSSAPELALLIRTAREVNDSKPQFVLARIKQCAARFKAPVIACLGLAFKADVDDLRESPAMGIVQSLLREQIGQLLIVEPAISVLPLSLRSGGVELSTLDAAVAAADVVVLLVNHRHFINFNRRKLDGKAVIDTRGVWR